MQKYLGLILDSMLSVEEYLTGMGAKVSTNCKAFIHSYLDFRDIFTAKHSMHHFMKKRESIQWNACLAITGAIRGSSRDKTY